MHDQVVVEQDEIGVGADAEVPLGRVEAKRLQRLNKQPLWSSSSRVKSGAR